jgi:ubiquinone/menaquinone biosynthesis C-methylase UbiE
MAQRHYVHVGGQEGRERLRVLGRIFAPATAALLDRLGVGEGMRCLDVGCGGGDVSVELARRVGNDGEVTAIDFDAGKLEIARQEAAELGLANLIYIHTDLFDLTLDQPVDVVYARFVLAHLKDPVAALRRMAEVTKLGGLLIVEDADASANFCHPPNEAYDLYSRLYREAMRARGTDPDIGPRLPHLLKAAGFADIGLGIHQPAELMAGDVKLLVALTLDSVAEPAVEAGLATAEEVRAASEQLHNLAKGDDVVMGLPRIVQAWGKKV